MVLKTLEKALRDCELDAAILLPLVAAAPFKITTLKQLANYFEK